MLIKGKGELQTNNANCVFIRARPTGGALQLSAPVPEGLAENPGKWPSKRGPIAKIMPSGGSKGDTVPLAVER